MTKNIKFTIGLLLCFGTIFGQEAIDVTDQAFKLNGGEEKELCFGFAAGDKIVFSFLEANYKELKEIEIVEYPGNSKFSDYKTTKVENKTLNVSRTNTYIFRFKNSAIGSRVCKIKLSRIPASNDTKNFNTTVTWVDKQDTSWNTYTRDVVIGYDTTYVQKSKFELVKSDQNEELILDKTQVVHSLSNSNNSRTSIFFSLPQNENTPYKTTKVISWAYWIGVDEEGNKAWEQNAQTLKNLVEGVATIYSTPLGALAIGAITDLSIPSIGEDVEYYIADPLNAQLFMAGNPFRMYDNGKGVAGYRKFTEPVPCQGQFYILLANDNIMQGINVNVKVVAIIETNIYEEKHFTDQVVKPRTEKQLFREPKIVTSRIPVVG